MEFIFEFIFEVIFEVIFEGIWKLGTSKKVWLPVRIILLLLFLFICGSIPFLCFFLAIISFKEGNTILGIVSIVLGIVIAIGIVRGFIKKYR